MPRLNPILLHRASLTSPLLSLLLRETRSLPLARAELRWLKAHVTSLRPRHSRPALLFLLRSLVYRRARLHEPLQLILGTAEVGSLSLLCERGVLIPRWETANLCEALARRLLKEDRGRRWRVADLCCGAGTMALVIARELGESCESVRGVDVSERAVGLARRNVRRVLGVEGEEKVKVSKGDVFTKTVVEQLRGEVDVLVCNPPYVSERAWRGLARAVKRWEPKRALVSSEGEQDTFYARVWDVAKQIGAERVLVEVGDEEQARRVLLGVLDWTEVEVWRDWPDERAEEEEEWDIQGRKVLVRGVGEVRGVYTLR